MKRNNLNIAAINPSLGDKFSPNLWRFMKRQGKSLASVQLVYQDTNGILWIGYVDDHWFTGTLLMQVLCDFKAQIFAHIGKAKELTEVTDFWERYARDGRCAIDQDHSMYFIGDQSRWSIEGGKRSCQWCGHHVQVKLTWQETTDHSAWVPA